jgi:hypothetical protein
MERKGDVIGFTKSRKSPVATSHLSNPFNVFPNPTISGTGLDLKDGA